MNNISAVVLAAGKGKRMMSKTQKVLHKINGQPMVYYSLQNLLQAGINNLYVVVGFQAEKVKKVLGKDFKCHFVLQDKPLGTGDALRRALEIIDPAVKSVIVVGGDDSAFYSPQTLKDFVASHLKSQAPVTMMTLELADDDNSYGKVVRDNKGNFQVTLESKEYKNSGLYTKEINAGAYVFDVEWAKIHVNQIPLSQKGEYYINDLLNIAHAEGTPVNLYLLENLHEWMGVNTKDDLEKANKLMQQQQNT